MGKPTICLNMIVKNEEHVIIDALRCAAPLVDTWVIVDTGSTDRTCEVVKEFFEKAGIPGELYTRPWKDFGTNRTEALRLARPRADYAWVMDADDVVVGDLGFGDLGLDAYMLRFGQDFRYWRTQLFSSVRPWRFVGAVHEYATCEDGPYTQARIDGTYHVESRRLGDRNRAANKYPRDCALLEEALEADPHDARSVFYLAQSWFDAGDREKALDRYLQRAAMGGFNEEVFYSLLRAARCMQDLGHPFERVLSTLLSAHQTRPTRAEPLFELARHYRLAGEHHLAYLFAKRGCEIPFPEGDCLFVFKDAYDFKLPDELSIAAYWTGRYRESLNICTALLDDPLLPENERRRVQRNRDFAVERTKEAFARYPAGEVEKLTRRVRRIDCPAEVTLTVTSCKRPALLERTLNSFIGCCADLDRIGRFVCVDDNSDPADVDRIRELYPFLEIVRKGPADRGHARSMNIIREMVESPWWLHLEDDWHFIAPLPYVGRAIEILEDDGHLGQVLFNRNYGETLQCAAIAGGRVKRTRVSGARYLVHEHVPAGTEGYARHLAGLGAGSRTNAWWPHYSLRPSLLRTEAARDLGPYDERADHFELDFAHRWNKAGLRSAFFDVITCLHTGRLTWQSKAHGALNAYDLNDEPQFTGRTATQRLGVQEKQQTFPVCLGEVECHAIDPGLGPDRMAAIERLVGAHLEMHTSRSVAVSGKAPAVTGETAHLFRDTDLGCDRAGTERAMSHVELWRRLATREEYTYLVLENGVTLASRFAEKLDDVLEQVGSAEPDADMVFLGHHVRPGLLVPEIFRNDAPPFVVRMRFDGYVGGTYAYLVTARGAASLVRVAEKNGIHAGIDGFIVQSRDELRILECLPHIVTSDHTVF